MIQLSVIIPTRNRAEILFDTLVSIENQTLDQSLFEVIVCDNNSSDNTSEIAHSFLNRFQNFSYIKTIEPGLHVGRNKGIQEAKAQILIFIDDDVEALSTWLEGIWESFQEEDVMMVGGNNFPKYEISPPIWVESLWNYNQYGKYNGHYSLIDFGDKMKEINPYFIFGCNFAIRRKILLELGGFHPDGMPLEKIVFRGDGESYISQMMVEKGLKAIFNPKASVYHLVSKNRMTKEYLYHRGFIQGISNSYTQFRNNNIKKQINHKQNRQIMHTIFEKIINRIMLRDIKDNIEYIKAMLTNSENEYLKAFNSGLSDGYNFHQNELRINKELEIWVLKSNYF